MIIWTINSLFGIGSGAQAFLFSMPQEIFQIKINGVPKDIELEKDHFKDLIPVIAEERMGIGIVFAEIGNYNFENKEYFTASATIHDIPLKILEQILYLLHHYLEIGRPTDLNSFIEERTKEAFFYEEVEKMFSNEVTSGGSGFVGAFKAKCEEVAGKYKKLLERIYTFITEPNKNEGDGQPSVIFRDLKKQLSDLARQKGNILNEEEAVELVKAVINKRAINDFKRVIKEMKKPLKKGNQEIVRGRQEVLDKKLEEQDKKLEEQDKKLKEEADIRKKLEEELERSRQELEKLRQEEAKRIAQALQERKRAEMDNLTLETLTTAHMSVTIPPPEDRVSPQEDEATPSTSTSGAVVESVAKRRKTMPE